MFGNATMFGNANLGLLIGGGAALFAAAALWRALNARPLYGRARFATGRDLRKAGLREKRGLLVGKFRGRYLIFGGSGHVIVYAPTRGGKGVGVVIPNLLNWPDSAIVLDVKKENWTITAGFRKACGQEVFLFDPFDPEGRTARYNPLAYARRDNPTDLYDDLQRIAAMLFPIEGRTVDPFWTESARAAFLAIGGYVAETPELPFTIGEVLRQFAAAPDVSKHFQTILQDRAEDRPLSRQCQTAMNDFLAASENTLQSVRKTVTARLGLWLNARVDAATSANDFDLRELRRAPMTVYLGAAPGDLARMAPLLNLFFQQAVDLNARTLPEHDPSLKLQLLLMMDEFRALGNVEILARGVSYVAGYGVRIVTVIQSPAQLREVYGPDAAASYMTNHAVEIAFTPKEHSVAAELSERFGYAAAPGRSRSRSLGFSRSSRTETESEQRRALMLPQELVLTPFEDEYVLKGGIPPVKARKILYYKEPAFKKRLLPPPVVEPVAAVQVPSQPVERAPRLEEIAAAEQPADGAIWRLPGVPDDLGNALRDAPPAGDLEARRASVETVVSQWLDSVMEPPHDR